MDMAHIDLLIHAVIYLRFNLNRFVLEPEGYLLREVPSKHFIAVDT